MQQGTKKVVVVTTVSFGILVFSYLIPAVIMPMYLNVAQAGSCTDYGCAQDAFARCGTAMGESETAADTWMKGMEDMLCMMGIGSSAKATAFGYSYIFN